MKTSLFCTIGLIIFTGITSCEETNKEMVCQNYCVSTIISNPDSILLSLDELNVIRSLFKSNNLEFRENYQFFSSYIYGHIYKRVVCYQYINNLKIVPYNLYFEFNSAGTFLRMGNCVIDNISISPEPVSNANCVVERFVNETANDIYYYGSIAEFKKGFFEVELVYYDMLHEDCFANSKFKKAWRIKLKNQEYPRAFIEDNSLKIISYENGKIIDK